MDQMQRRYGEVAELNRMPSSRPPPDKKSLLGNLMTRWNSSGLDAGPSSSNWKPE